MNTLPIGTPGQHNSYPTNFDHDLEICLQGLLEKGAQVVIPQYSVATGNQVDVVINERRFLLTPDNEAYRQYAQTMGDISLPFLKPNLDVSTDRVVAGELPRDARPLAQVLRSKTSSEGTTPDDVMRQLGNTIHHLAAEKHTIPDIHDFSLNRVLVMRVANTIMLLPPFSFVPAEETNNTQFVEKIHQELWLRFSRYRANNLFQAFSEGL